MNTWTHKEISNILKRLDDDYAIFEKYSLRGENGELSVIGEGASALVYAAKKRNSNEMDYAIKVMGFLNRAKDTESFNELINIHENGLAENKYVIKNYGYKELWLEFDEMDNFISANSIEPENSNLRIIKLQFIVMERLNSVFHRNNYGGVRLYPYKLSNNTEEEIVKLAFDIGESLKQAHSNNILHRDVKLENVFYSEKYDCYKLGDFGIAKKTDDGFAATIAFTNGYAAPEVKGMPNNDRYNKTADIYSFGMMLYVLANKNKFPSSNSYVASNYQYMSGYVLPKPDNDDISDRFYKILAKACSYDPINRYQTIDEMLKDMRVLLYKENYSYRVKNRENFFAFGIITLIIGVVLAKLLYFPEARLYLKPFEYIFLLIASVKAFIKKDSKLCKAIDLVLLLLGLYLCFTESYGMVAYIIVALVAYPFFIHNIAVTISVFMVNIVSIYQDTSHIQLNSLYQFRYISFILIIISICIFLEDVIKNMQRYSRNKKLYRTKIIHIIRFIMLIDTIIIDEELLVKTFSLIPFLNVDFHINPIIFADINKAGVISFILVIAYYVVERLLSRIEKYKYLNTN